MLLHSSYLGGGSADAANAIAVDNAGGVWMAGNTRSADFPVLNALQPRFGGYTYSYLGGDAFFVKLTDR